VSIYNLTDGAKYIIEVTPYVLQNGKKVYKTPTTTSIVTYNLKKVANYAKAGKSTQSQAGAYSSAWVSGVYEAAGYGYPSGTPINFWNKWSFTGSTSIKNMPIGAVVVGTGLKGANNKYGQLGIYVGNNEVIDCIGPGMLRVTPLNDWIKEQNSTCQGKKGFIGWVIPGISK